MDKRVRAAVFERATPPDSLTPICEECFDEVATECHHAVGGNGKRKQHESVETCFALGNRCHGLIESKDGIWLRRKLQLIAQQRLFDKGLTEEQVRLRMGGKIYQEVEG